jgi:hypothetical protein
MCFRPMPREITSHTNDRSTYSDTSSKSPSWEDEIDEFVIESLLEEEIREFKNLVRIQKIMQIAKNKPGYII